MKGLQEWSVEPIASSFLARGESVNEKSSLLSAFHGGIRGKLPGARLVNFFFIFAIFPVSTCQPA